MIILKNAVRNVMRAKGRSVLIGIIVVIIAFSVCIGLCIRQSSSDARDEALAEMNITAQISPDRQMAMDKSVDSGGGFDPSKLSDMMGTELTLEELQTYAEADSVKGFYYTMTASVNGGSDLEAYSTSSDDEESEESSSFGGERMGFGASGDFSITGYSDDDAMTAFVEGTSTIAEGSVFQEGTTENVCIISDELAEYNGLAVGDSIQIVSTEDEEQTYSLEIVGIYNNSQSSATAGGMQMRGMTDPANDIYTSYNTLKTLTEACDTIETSISGTYVLGDVEAYEAFQKEASDLGLTDEYVISSTDITAYEQSSKPLENLAKYAGYFLIVILLIGGVILVVLNIFTVRERKYEIGVLAAIGMHKKKVAALFMSEVILITIVGACIGGGIGAAASVPVTNALLSSQIEAQQDSFEDKSSSFGRDFGGMEGEQPPSMPEDADSASMSASDLPFGGAMSNYITEISSSVDLGLLLQLMGICILLAALSGLVSVVTIMRYEPLQILANRD